MDFVGGDNLGNQPGFRLILSAKPITAENYTLQELSALANGLGAPHTLAVHLYGKTTGKDGRFSYWFGRVSSAGLPADEDTSCAWNTGPDFQVAR